VEQNLYGRGAVVNPAGLPKGRLIVLAGCAEPNHTMNLHTEMPNTQFQRSNKWVNSTTCLNGGIVISTQPTNK